MVNVRFFNENGNVAVKTRENLRKQVIAKVVEVLADAELNEVKVNANGGVSFAIASDTVKGETVWAHLDLTVSTKSPDVKTERKRKAKAEAKAEDVVPSIFDGE